MKSKPDGTPAEQLAAAKQVSALKNHHRKRKCGKLVCLVRDTREQLGLSLHDVADATEISPGALSVIERGGDVHMTMAQKLCRFFGMHSGELWPIGDEESSS